MFHKALPDVSKTDVICYSDNVRPIRAKTSGTFHKALQDILKNDVICFSNNGVYPIRDQETFLKSISFPIQNAQESYKRGEVIELFLEVFDSVKQEKENISKLIRVRSGATAIDKNAINKLISQKFKRLCQRKNQLSKSIN